MSTTCMLHILLYLGIFVLSLLLVVRVLILPVPALHRLQAVLVSVILSFFFVSSEITTTTTPAATTDDDDSSSSPDIIIVGAGASGLSAAIAAAEKKQNGAAVAVRVHVLDRFHGGGSSAISGGVIYAGGGTRAQVDAAAAATAQGFDGDGRAEVVGDDTPENMLRYLRCEVLGEGGAAGGDESDDDEDAVVDDETLKRFCRESVSRMEWLEKHGVEFRGTLCPFRTSYPTEKYHLYFSGNEKAHPFRLHAKPAPRGHRVVGEGGGGMGMTGGVLCRTLRDAAQRLGVTFEMASKVDELVTSGGGDADCDGELKRRRVNGVKYRALDPSSTAFKRHRILVRKADECYQMSQAGVARWLHGLAHAIWDGESREKTLRARKAVVLAAGGYVMNDEMMSEFVPWTTKGRVAPLGTAGDDGSGIRLGQSVGGYVSHMDRVSTWRLLYPPESLLEGIVVSKSGERIAAEDLYGASLSDVMTTKFDGRAYLLLDSVQWGKAVGQIREQTQMPWTLFIRYLVHWAHYKAGSIPDLARSMGVDVETVEATIDAYNHAITNDEPDPVGKVEWRSAIAKAPFYGIDVSLRPSGLLVSPVLPLGGLKVDGSSGMVLDEWGGKIQGLYAVGKNALGVSSNRYVSGLALADCVFSGKRSGEHAAASV